MQWDPDTGHGRWDKMFMAYLRNWGYLNSTSDKARIEGGPNEWDSVWIPVYMRRS